MVLNKISKGFKSERRLNPFLIEYPLESVTDRSPTIWPERDDHVTENNHDDGKATNPV